MKKHFSASEKGQKPFSVRNALLSCTLSSNFCAHFPALIFITSRTVSTRSPAGPASGEGTDMCTHLRFLLSPSLIHIPRSDLKACVLEEPYHCFSRRQHSRIHFQVSRFTALINSCTPYMYFPDIHRFPWYSSAPLSASDLEEEGHVPWKSVPSSRNSQIIISSPAVPAYHGIKLFAQ